jgi:thiamine biosynthesis protein ThiS
VELIVNGENRSLDGRKTIAQYLADLNLEPKRVVVEHNRIIVPRDCYAEIVLQPGDELEIVQMMAGG